MEDQATRERAIGAGLPCATCGRVPAAHDRFCRKCGRTLMRETPPSPGEPVPRPVPSPTPGGVLGLVRRPAVAWLTGLLLVGAAIAAWQITAAHERTAKRELAAQVVELRSTLTGLMTELGDLRTREGESAGSIEVLTQQLGKLKQRNQALREENRTLQVQYDELAAAYDELARQSQPVDLCDLDPGSCDV